MKKPVQKEDNRLTRFNAICLALPEATRQIMGRHAGFLILVAMYSPCFLRIS